MVTINVYTDGSYAVVPDAVGNATVVQGVTAEERAAFHQMWMKALDVLPGHIRCKVIREGSTHADLLEQTYHMVEMLTKYWPRTASTLDQVRDGRASVDGIPVPPESQRDVKNG